MCMGFTEKKWKNKEVIRLRALYTVLTKGDKLEKNDCTKERGFGLLEPINCGKVTGQYMGKTNSR